MEKRKTQIDWKNVFKLGFILFVISAVAACCLAFTNYVTAGTIEKMDQETNKAARQEVLSEATDFEEIPAAELVKIRTEIGLENPDELVEAYQGKTGDDVIGYTVKTAPQSGYSGEVQVLTGISKEGLVQGVTILKHNETPGLGALATEPAFKDQYKDLSAAEKITVVKTAPASGSNSIQAITGATITSKAVTDGVNISNEVYLILSK
ncbi:RnfABCDGE type electron transport complex subunit G [Acetobacterium fimetarium]|uniref:Ion-translocating oxidoreductase complex subunit G n=1 Tax=Acetobacterium fimetarium TaxID=52691 RepID=A0ABR6WWG4_9FIRM|nr:RnfABCDGE type electron transport complex subunit G [Acetobacterium fimetarium]MBC3804927.1 RnfABCDGE type electron transport complex subunit G [Acetobacterium fimetarium]